MRRKRYRGYPTRYRYRRPRRIHFRAVFRAVLIVLLAGIIAFCARMVYQAFHADAVIAQLEAQNQTLQQTVDRYTAVLPDPALTEQVQAQPMAYQTLYPEMRVDPIPQPAAAPAGTVYLTFDGGPSQNTVTILDTLKRYGQKATFFVVGKNIPGNEAILKRMVDEGHTIGVRSYSGDYNAIYASPEAFLEDFHQSYQAVYDACGVYPTIFRFPGGSVSPYNQANYEQLIAEMLRRGFVYYDWSVSAGDDTSASRTITQITQAVLAGLQRTTATPIVLLHDSADKADTAHALANLVSELDRAGYTCDRLTNSVRQVTFAYAD